MVSKRREAVRRGVGALKRLLSPRQAARTNEDFHNMGSLYMSEICTEMKNLRSLVRVCEIQATLREQR